MGLVDFRGSQTDDTPVFDMPPTSFPSTDQSTDHIPLGSELGSSKSIFTSGAEGPERSYIPTGLLIVDTSRIDGVVGCRERLVIALPDVGIVHIVFSSLEVGSKGS